MTRNIVICCDGTDNKLTLDQNSNVVHLYSCLVKNENQITYYNPGVGTIEPDSFNTKIKRFFYNIRDRTTAISLKDKVRDAYIFLIENYEAGDQIYLFGFSRGAYTVRMLSGMIDMFGLIHKGNTNHLRYILDIYAKVDNEFAMANTFKHRFSRDIKIRFIGVWDTVVSVGNIFTYKRYFYSQNLKIAQTVRHAIAIDERRKLFYHYEVKPTHNDLMECYFAGVHSDVGGSYLEKESGLSKIALEWMLAEASHNGLKLNKEDVKRYLYGYEPKGQRNIYGVPNISEQVHNSLKPLYWFLALFPRKIVEYVKNDVTIEGSKSKAKTKKVVEEKVRYDWRLFPLREIPLNNNKTFLHESVIEKINTTNYAPVNIKDIKKYQIAQTNEIIY